MTMESVPSGIQCPMVAIGAAAKGLPPKMVVMIGSSYITPVQAVSKRELSGSLELSAVKLIIELNISGGISP